MSARGPKFEFVMAWVACAAFCCVSPPSRAESSPGRPAVLARSPSTPSIDDLIQQLGDPNSRKRGEASEQLRTMTAEPLRPALLEAAHHAENPEIRRGAAKLLCSLPWSKPGDLDSVRIALGDYRSPIIERRAEALARLGAMGSVAAPAMVRLLSEEPSDDVRWAIVAQLRMMEEGSRPQLRELRPANDDAPALAAAGWGWQASDPERAAPLFHRAVDLATTQPVDDHGEADRLVQLLMARAMGRLDYADAVELCRRHIWLTDAPAEAEVLGLFSLHAQYGPQPGFERDVRVFEQYFAQPPMMYVLGRVYARQGNPLAAEACYVSAAASSIGDAESHVQVAEFLMSRQWFDLARPELRRAIRNREDSVARDADIYLYISKCADAMGDDLLAAADLETGVAQFQPLSANAIAQQKVGELTTLADWHRLRDAAQKQNRAELARLANRLMATRGLNLNPLAALDVEIDLARALKTLGRATEGKQVFDQAYPKLRELVEKKPRDAESLNNLAWLCARSGENLEEAYQLSKEAIKLTPGNAAYLDTAAEAAAALNKWDEAVQLETSALALQPGDKFMTQQVERFRAGAKSVPARQ